jgi:hypothetical protein
MLACVLHCACFAQAPVKPHKQTAAEKEQVKQTARNIALELAKASMGKDGWQDISSAPSFAAPLFRGNQTKFLKADSRIPTYQVSQNKIMTLFTRDPVTTVYTWYARALPASGFVLDSKFPAQKNNNQMQVMMLKGDSPTATCSVSILKRDDQNGPASQISVSVFNRPVSAQAQKK